MARSFDYETLDDAPEWHRVVAGYAATGKLTQKQIADCLGVTERAVKKVLADDLVKAEIARIEAKVVADGLNLSATMLELRDDAVKAVRDVLRDPEASHSTKLKAAGLVFDRDPEALFVKQAKSTTQNTLNIYDSKAIVQVKQRAFELEQQAKTVEIIVEEEHEDDDGTASESQEVGHGEGSAGDHEACGASLSVEAVGEDLGQ